MAEGRTAEAGVTVVAKKHADTTSRTKTVRQLRREAELEPPAKQRKDQEIYECHSCDKKFQEEIYLKIHREACHNVTARERRSKGNQPIAIVESAATKLQVQLLNTTDQVDSQNLLALLGYAEEAVQPVQHRVITSDNVRSENFESSQIIYDIGLHQLVEAADADQANGQVAYLHLPQNHEESQIVPDNDKEVEGGNDKEVEDGNDKEDNTIVISEIKKELECQDDDGELIVPDQHQGDNIEMAAIITRGINDNAQTDNDSPNESMEISQESDNAAMSSSLQSVESFLEKENQEINHNGVQSIESFLSRENDVEENRHEDSPQCTDDSLADQNDNKDNVLNDIPQSAKNQEGESKNTSEHHLNILPNLNDIPVSTVDKEAMENIFSDSENEEDDRPPYLEIIFNDDDKDEDLDDKPRPSAMHLPDLVEAAEAQKESTKAIEIEEPKVESNVAEESNNEDQVA